MFFSKSKLSFLSKVFIVLFFVLLATSGSNAQELKYSGSWGPAGFTMTRSNTSGVEINYSLTNVTLSDVNIDGTTMKSVTVPGIFLPNDPGMPDLAGSGRYLAIPQGSYVTYKIISYRKEVIQNIDVAPAPVLPLDNDPTPMKYNKNMSVYGRNSLYPDNIVKISQITSIRGVDAVVLGITPFQYNPSTKELIIYRDLKVQVDFVGGNGKFGDIAYRSRYWEPILSDVFLNYNSLPVVDFDKQYANKNLETGYEYVIIRPNNALFAPWADTLKKFRTEQGIKTGIYTVADIGGNTVAAIKAWVNNAYTTWTIKPSAICLMGDYSTEATGANGIISILQTHPAGYPAFASDNYYSDVNGDEMPEIVFSRIIGNNATELQTLISKNLDYERNPPMSFDYYNKPITALGWQTERWFQICSEVLGGFFKKSLGKLPQRINKIYSGTPGTQWSTATNTAAVVNYFGTVGLGYIPMTPDSLGSWDGGNATMINNAINSGSFLLQHRDHGMYTGWGEPSYTTSNASGLTNTMLTFIYSINCQTGAYHDPSGCPAEGSFVEVFYRYKYNNQNSGALGMVCPSEVSYSFVNDTYCWGMYDNMWPGFMPGYGTTPPSRDVKPAFGMAAGKYFLQQSSWPYNTGDKLVTYRLFHMHGDAFLNLYYNVPQALTMTVPATIFSGQTTVTITAAAGAFVALTLNGEILGVATGTGSPQVITIPGTQLPTQQIKVVATKQNYLRYENSINVIPPSGPYVVYHNTTINDASPMGNGNGLMDYGETNKLNLKVKNVGVTVATGVNVICRSNDAYVTMTDSTESYGTINAGDSVLVNNAFTYTVANNIPDGRSVNFTIIATSGSNTWTSGFSITAHSAVLKYNGFSVVDSTGNNNNRWDPGETIKLYVKAKNTGTSAVTSVVGNITKNSSYVTINTNNVAYGTINGLDSTSRFFSVTSAANTPLGTDCKFVITYTGALGVTASDSFNVVIGNNVASIGNGSTLISYPYYTYYMDSRTDMLYLSSEIAATGVSNPGSITAIGFNVSSIDPYLMNGFNIKMQNYSGSTISGWTNTGWTTVYSGTYQVTGTGWQMINLQTPFQWNGSNLLIEICFDNTGYSSISTSTQIYGFTPYTGMVYHNHIDNGTGCSLTSSSTVSARPNIKLMVNAPMGIGNLNNGIPTKFELAQNYPNPFNPTTKINYAIPKQSLVSLKIYDVLGREVATLVNDVKQADYYSLEFDASMLSSGVYFYKLVAGDFVEVKRMVLLK